MTSVEANATSTVALVPGSAAAARGYRRELEGTGQLLRLLIAPSLLGGLVGALLVVWLPGTVFDFAVPWLLLTASLLFLFQPVLGRFVRSQATSGEKGQRPPGAGARSAVVAFQFAVAVYGGYFGAGIGILMLTALAFIAPGNIHRLNAVKTFLAACINGVAVFIFVAGGKVVWGYGLTMAVAGLAGGFCGAHFGRRLPPAAVRWFVVAAGLALTAHQFARRLTSGG
jgi:uncharacterized membrane protein YfcA